MLITISFGILTPISVCACVCGGDFSTPAEVWEFNSILTLHRGGIRSVGEGSFLHTHTRVRTRCSPGGYLCFWPIHYKWEAVVIPSHSEWQSQVQVATCVLVSQTCSTLCDPKDCRPGSSVHGIFWQEYWKGLPFLSPGDLPNPGVQPGSSCIALRPLFGFSEFARVVTELRETFHLLDHWLLWKTVTQDNWMEETHRASYM